MKHKITIALHQRGLILLHLGYFLVLLSFIIFCIAIDLVNSIAAYYMLGLTFVARSSLFVVTLLSANQIFQNDVTLLKRSAKIQTKL